MNIKIDYGNGVKDTYPIDESKAPELLKHFLDNPNVDSVSFHRTVGVDILDKKVKGVGGVSGF